MFGNSMDFHQVLLEIPEVVEFQVQLPIAVITTSMLNALIALVALQLHITQLMFNPKLISKVIYKLIIASQIVDVKTVYSTPAYDITAV